MSAKISNTNRSLTRSVSIIGASTRIEGQINFVGTLRVQGDILGDVTGADTGSTTVVDRSGSVVGTVKSASIVVKGRIDGPIQSAQLIQVHSGASVIGGASYKMLEIHPGAIVEGLIAPASITAAEQSIAQSTPVTSPTTIDDTPFEPDRIVAPNRAHWLQNKRAWGFALLIAALVYFSFGRPSTPPEPESTATVFNAPTRDVTTSPPPAADTLHTSPSPAAAGSLPTNPPRTGAVVPGTVAAVPESATPAAAQDRPEVDMRKAMLIQGLNPAKSADVLFVVTREPAVLIKKKRDDSAEETRVDIPQRRNQTVPVSRSDLVRVARGSGLELFYQGRKVGQKTIDSGVWMNFVPMTAEGGAAPR